MYTVMATVSDANYQGSASATLTIGIAAQTITSNSATALAVGPNGTTNPTFSVNANTASAATGLTVIGAAAASGVALNVISSGTNENLTISAKGTGTINLNGATNPGFSVVGAASAASASSAPEVVSTKRSRERARAPLPIALRVSSPKALPSMDKRKLWKRRYTPRDPAVPAGPAPQQKKTSARCKVRNERLSI
jgi:hypothetical protein